MTDKTNGLRLAADKPSKDDLSATLASASTAQILAGMSGEQKAELAETLAPAPKADEPKAEENAEAKPKAEGDKPEPKAETPVGDRSAAVFASEHSKGKERMAGDLMASFPNASADEIIAHLAKAEASEDGGDDAMLEHIQHADDDIGEGGGEPAANDDNHGWNKAHQKVAKMYGTAGRAAS